MIKPTDKIALGSYIEDIEEMHKKTIDPVTGRLFMKYSLQDDIKKKLQREKDRFEERYGHIETNVELKKMEKDADEQYKIIREMSLDTNFQKMPNEKVRHWLVAQSHMMMEDEGLMESLDNLELAQQAADPDHIRTYNQPSETERARAKNAYDTI